MLTLDVYVWTLLCLCPLVLSVIMKTRDSFRASIQYRRKPAFSSYVLKLVECLLQESEFCLIKILITPLYAWRTRLTLLISSQGCVLPYRDSFHRLLFAPWILGAFVVMQTFAGLLKANTAVKSPTSRIDSLEDLMASERVSVYYPRNMIIDTILHVRISC